MSGSNYQPGQVLTAAQLNSSFDSKTDNNSAAITGGSITGIETLEVSGTADSTSPQTGAVVVAGGVGVALDIQVGGGVTAAGEIVANAATQSVSPTTGALVVAGGVGVGGNANIGGSVNVAGTVAVALQLAANQTADSTSSTTGALVVSGGAGIEKTLNVGANANVGGILSVTGATNLNGALVVSSTTDSSSTSTGSITTAGGLGVAKALNVGTSANVTGQVNANASTQSTAPTNGAVVVAGGVGIAKNINVGGAASIAGVTSVTNTTASTASTNGAVVVSGGVGIAGDVNIGATLAVTGASTLAGVTSVTNLTASTTPTTGALVVTGGVGVGGNASIAGLLYGRTNPNLLYNSTGEFTNLGWTGTAFGGYNDPNYGLGSLFSNSAGLSASASDISSQIATGPSVAMTLAADLITTGVTAGTLSLTLSAYSSTNANLGVVCSINLANGVAQPTRVSASGTTPANTAYVTVTKGITGGTVSASAHGAGFRRIKVELGSFATVYSQEASFSATSSMTTANPTIASGPLTFADGSRQYSAAAGKNRIINGDCRVAQLPSVAAGPGAYIIGGVDRFRVANNSGGQFTQSQGSISYGGISLAAVVQTVNTPITSLTGSNLWLGIDQRIEGFNCFDLLGGSVTISFVFNSNVAGLYPVRLSDYTGNNSYVTTFNYNTANTPQKISITIANVPTSLTTPNSAAGGMEISIGLLNTGTFQTSTLNSWISGNYATAPGCVNWGATANNFIAVTLLQMEPGSVATPFERKEYGSSLIECQRFYCKTYPIGLGPGAITSSGNVFEYVSGSPFNAGQLCFNFPTTMRATPTVSAYSPITGNGGVMRDNANGADIVANLSFSDQSKAYFNGTMGTASNYISLTGHFVAIAEI